MQPDFRISVSCALLLSSWFSFRSHFACQKRRKEGEGEEKEVAGRMRMAGSIAPQIVM